MGAPDLLEALRGGNLDEIAVAVDAEAEREYDRKRGLAILAEEGLRFVLGDQWPSWRGNRNTGAWETTSPHQNRLGPSVQPTTNHCLPIVRALTSMLVKNPPDAVISSKDDDPSKVVARVAEAVLEVLEEDTHASQKKALLALWAVCTGTAAKENFVEYGPALDPTRLLRPEGSDEPFRDADGKAVEEKVPAKQRRISTRIVSLFELGVDEIATTPDELTRVTKYSVEDLDAVRGQYSPTDENGEPRPGYVATQEDLDDLEPDASLKSPLNMWHRLKYLGPGFYGSSELSFANAVVTKAAYVKPCVEYPSGCQVVVVGGKTVYLADGKEERPPNPYLALGRWHPFTFFRYFPTPGRFWGMGVLQHIVPIQRRINAIDAMAALHRATMLAPKIMMPKGHGIPQNYISGVPGLIIEYAPGVHPPIPLPGQDLPQAIWTERQTAVDEMKYVAGSADPLSGDRAKGLPSYSAQAFQYENANDAHRLTATEWEAALEDDAECLIGLAANLLDEDDPRMQRLVLENLKLAGEEIKSFRLSDLRDSVVIRIEPGASVPRSLVLQQQAAIQAVGSGAINLSNPQIRSKYLALLGLSSLDELSVTMRKVQVENAMIETNDPRLAFWLMPEENDAIHIHGHLECLEKNWARLTPEARNAGQLHIQAHQAAQMKKMQMMPQQAAGQGMDAARERGIPPPRPPQSSGAMGSTMMQ